MAIHHGNVGIVPEHAYDENYGQNPIGSGRYIMKQWDKGQQVILKQTGLLRRRTKDQKTDGAVYGRKMQPWQRQCPDR